MESSQPQLAQFSVFSWTMDALMVRNTRGMVDVEHVSGIKTTARLGVECNAPANLQPSTVHDPKQVQTLP